MRALHELPVIILPEDIHTAPGPFLAEMYAEHGSIFRFRSLGGDDAVFLVGPEATRAIMVSQRENVSNYGGWSRAERAVQIFGKGLTFLDGVEHGEHRKALSPAFTPKAVESFLPLINRVVREATDDWAQRREVDVYQEADRIMFDLAASILLGFFTRPQIDQLRAIYRQMFWLEMQALSTVAPAARFAWMAEQSRRLRGEMQALLGPVIAQRRRQPSEDALGRLCAADDGRRLTDGEVIEEVNTLLLAGHITTTSLCAWLIYLLVSHPAYLKRVLDEQQQLLGADEDPTGEQIRQMDVLENALKEAERLYPPIAHLPRTVTREFTFQDYHLPAGTFLVCSIAGGHRIGTIFPKPAEFDPDRFAPPRQEHLRTPYALIGFSGGPRLCLGISLARVEVKAIVSRVLRQFVLTLTPGQSIVQIYHPMSSPRDGIKMQVWERPGEAS